MSAALPEIASLLRQDEGQYFERKSLWDQRPGHRRPRDRRVVRDQVAEYVAAFANADGGSLLLGVEDDGTVTGHGYPDEAIEDILTVPARRLSPPMPQGRRVEHDGQELLLFVVDATPTAVMVTGNGFPYRVDDQVVLMSEVQINALKQQSLIESAEAQVGPRGSLDDLDLSLVSVAAEGAGLGDVGPAEYLVRRRLADWRGDQLVLRFGAMLLFAADPLQISNPEAPVIRRFRVRGTERQHGARGNVEELPPLEANLPTLVRMAYDWLSEQVQKSQRLFDLFFREMPEYPTFAWQEAIVNAVAHRDYRVATNCIEIWLFHDRLEVISPGGLVESVTLAALTTRKRVHASRNPRLNRVLSELGLMRRQGEGIPRMIEEMEQSWLPLPEFTADDWRFQVTLRNTPVLEGADPAWTAAVQAMDLPVRQKRILVCYADGEFTNSDYQRINQVDRDQAYREIRELVDRGLVSSNDERGRGARYRVARAAAGGGQPPSYAPLVRQLRDYIVDNGQLTNAAYRQIVGIDDPAKALAALTAMVEEGALVRSGARRWTAYTPGPRWDRWCSEQADGDLL